LTKVVYRVTVSFPEAELYELMAQRVSSSIGANVAKGCGRDGVAELSRFCSIAFGWVSVAAKLAAVLANGRSTRETRPVVPVAIPGDGAGDQSVESPGIKTLAGKA
jgi:four helix bundle protein